MAAKSATKKAASDGPAIPGVDTVVTENAGTAASQRKIPGNLPYLPASGTLKRALDGIQVASRPEKVNADFLENVLKLKGGAARATIPIMKKMGLLSSDATPTELYARFRTESGRGQAALQGLRSAFPEIFKRSEYAHSVEDAKLKDIIVEITGLKANDPVATAIRATFKVIKSYMPRSMEAYSANEQPVLLDDTTDTTSLSVPNGGLSGGIRLAYNINIVLPETSDLKVLNAIFRSIKENLLR